MKTNEIRKITQGPDLYINAMDLGSFFRGEADVRLASARRCADSESIGVMLSHAEALGEADAFLKANQKMNDMQKEVLDKWIFKPWWKKFW